MAEKARWQRIAACYDDEHAHTKLRRSPMYVLHLESLLECSARLRHSLSWLSTLDLSQLETRQRSSMQTAARTSPRPVLLPSTSTIVHEGDEVDHELDDVPDLNPDSDAHSEDDVKSDTSHDEEDSKNPVRLLSSSQSTLGYLSTDNAFVLVDGAQHHEERRIVEDLADTDRFESCRKLNIIEPCTPLSAAPNPCTSPLKAAANFDAGVLARGTVRVTDRAHTPQIECLEATLIAGYHADSPTSMGYPGHRGTEAVGEGHSAEPRDVEREAGEVSSDGAM
ncbi:uncharacterized protein BXZ73DRAFT_76568 [Epithele typhae]|uniref:uncharacterized protein n=1 Tax=Epithele typhae TaxID=378194 RepID=UPI0020083E29|nr:uncharacterized protein BXZ73DRAFT_76568 [Epithele typhae]KAH9936744.1 hypothetical protein BXZ73DRAFT_76568 [Epithele typhae]